MKLSERYADMTPQQRVALAKAVGISDPGYLWQLATRWNGRRPSIALMARLAKADSELTLTDMAQEFSEPVAPRITASAQA